MNSASEYKDLRSKVDKLMVKINSTNFHFQEESEKTTPSKPKGTTDKDSCAKRYDKDGYPIIPNLAHGSMNCKLPINAHKKEATLFNQMGGIYVTNKPNKLQVGSDGYAHFSNNLNYYITQSPP